MNKLHIILFICLPVCLSISAYSDEFEKVYQQQLHQGEKIEKLAAQFFEPIHQQPLITYAEALTVEKILDRNYHQKMLKLHHAFSIALDSGINIDGLAKYGVKKRKNNKYAILQMEIPQWASISDIFWYLGSNSQFSMAKQDLRSMGLTNKDLAIIKENITKNNIRHAILDRELATHGLVKTQLAAITSNDAKAAFAAKLINQLYRQEQIDWHNWIVKLLSQFNRVKQQALLDYGVQKLVISVTSSSHASGEGLIFSKQKSLSYAKRIINGEQQESLKYEKIRLTILGD